MYVAVKFWKYSATKPSDAPDYWPKSVIELGSSRTLPGPEWVLMTKDDLRQYKAQRQDLYDAWKAANTPESKWADPDAPEEE